MQTGYTLTPEGTSDGSGFYAGTSRFTLKCTELTGDFSLVLLLDETTSVTGIPTESNLQYIDQVTIKDGEATFTIIPKAMTDGATYNVYVSTNGENGSLKQVASFQYGTKPPYTLGDVNNDGDIDPKDAVLVLRYSADLIPLGKDQQKAADVNGDGSADPKDAVKILRFSAGLIKSFEE